MLRKLKNMIYTVMDKLGHRVMNTIFIIAFILLLLFIGMGTVIPELNRQTYEGKIVQKYAENHSVTTGKTYFIEVQQGNKTVKIENADILLRQKFDSEDIQKGIKEGQTAKIETIGFNAPQWELYPNLTHIEQK
ncbi:hypothetical protein [Staphylococcus chromogenes]|uniref:hypothetical protein n=1 Tax=Staphylococcus chromogenes TaxID=46126 RepID=UPI001F53ECE6|nr:hypothetical protein [Staphylococcus chromogenes]